MSDLSGSAVAGRILILIGFIIGIFGLGMMIFYSSIFSSVPVMATIFIVLGIIQIVGAVFGILAFILTLKKEFKRAGIFGIIASFLPPLNIVMLIGGILCLTSREAKY